MNDPAIDGFVRRQKAGRNQTIFFSALYVLTLVTFSILHIRLARTFEMRPRFVILPDPTTLLVSREKGFMEAKTLHVAQAELAVQTMFNRNPGGLDSEARARRLFDTPSFNKLMETVKAQDPEFEAKGLSQKIEISGVKILKLQERALRVAVYGQLIRTGHFEGSPYSEALAVKVDLVFSHNPSLLENGMYPTIVRSFDIHTEPISQP